LNPATKCAADGRQGYVGRCKSAKNGIRNSIH